MGKKVWLFFKEIFSILLISILIAVVIKAFIVDSRTVPSASMYPTIHVGDKVLINKFIYHFTDIKTGDIIVFSPPDFLDMKSDLIKRVIGTPGDTVEVKRNDKVYVNDKALDEPYLDNEWANAIRDTVDAFTEDFTEVCLQEDEYWLMGDNRINSRDSRDFGPFKRSQIKGKDALVIFPFHKIHIPK